eukprot:tig00021127_g18805.t1
MSSASGAAAGPSQAGDSSSSRQLSTAQQRERESKDDWGSRTVDIFEKVEQIGEGTYGQVYRCKNKQTGEIVALKKVRMDNEKEGFPITAIREIKILRQLDHSNVIKLKEIVTSAVTDYSRNKGSIYMVFEYMDHDLTGLMDTGIKFTAPQIKCYMKQLLEGLHYCHTNQVLHRDIKGSNLLIDNKGQLKLADFGLARPYNDQNKDYTNRVITLWYRPPELLLGATSYGPAIDMWSVGCIFAELLTRRPLFPGKNEIDQLDQIFKKCGTPDEQSWPEASKLPWYHMFKPQRPMQRRLMEDFKQFQQVREFPITEGATALLDKLLQLDPKKRISAHDALDHEYFWIEPRPCNPASLPTYESSHEYQTKMKRQQQRESRQGGPGGPPPPSGSAPPPGRSGPPPGGQQQRPSGGPPPPGPQNPHMKRDGGGPPGQPDPKRFRS